MGQQMIIIALLASFLVSMAVLGLRDAWKDSDNIAASQFEEEQVLNLSSSGVNMSISKLRHNNSWRSGYSNVSLTDQGKLNVTVQDIGEDSVRITSSGTYNGMVHTSVVDVLLTSAVPMAESALAIYGDEVNLNTKGKAFGIDGNDHKADGSSGVGQPVAGIAVPTPAIEALLESELIKDKVYKNVTGLGGWPSVDVATITNQQVVEMRNYFRDNASITLPAGHDAGNYVYGSLAEPEIVYVAGDKRWTGRISGTGILVVDGSLKIGGNVQWTGLIISIAHDVSIEFGDHGNPEVNGAVIIGTEVPSDYKVTNVKINGNPQINYSHEALETVMENLSLMDVSVLNYYE